MAEIKIKTRERKQRKELTLPPVTFHHLDNWRPTIGNDAFLVWQIIYTLADRHKYPNQNIVHKYSYETLSNKLGFSKDKTVKLIKILYEFGLVDVLEQKNKFGGVVNLYVWNDVPEYSDTQYCELKRFRSWTDRNSEGQRKSTLARLKKRLTKKESQTEIQSGSQTEKTTGSQTEIQSIVIDQNSNYTNIIDHHQEDFEKENLVQEPNNDDDDLKKKNPNSEDKSGELTPLQKIVIELDKIHGKEIINTAIEIVTKYTEKTGKNVISPASLLKDVIANIDAYIWILEPNKSKKEINMPSHISSPQDSRKKQLIKSLYMS